MKGIIENGVIDIAKDFEIKMITMRLLLCFKCRLFLVVMQPINASMLHGFQD